MNIGAKKLEDAVVNVIGLDRVSTEDIADLVSRFASVLAPELSKSELDSLAAIIETRVNIHIEVGVGISAGHVPWLQGRKASLEWKRWNAYSQVLRQKGLNPVALQVMSERADLILDYAGDPMLEGEWNRRGLVIGDVQSGKTSNYLGLFNKAADAGYKVFILLAGSTDSLRKQTQKRVDEGFVGKDSSLLGDGLTSVGARLQIGVGHLGVTAQSLTTVHRDFQASTVKNTNLEIEALSSPVVFVVKKNKKILDNLANWLRPQIAKGESRLKMPMILLDDEADYASINTNDPDQDPTAINSAIANILGLFYRNSYVGFTATPFANVLIDDEAEEDLFPKDFIFSLESPDNYFGPDQMFDSSIAENFIIPIDDAHAVVPFGHKSNLQVSQLPKSLEDAILSFFIVNAIRDLRGQAASHRSMLVNVSRYKRVQQQIFEKVLDFVVDLKSALNFQTPDNSDLVANLHKVYSREFGDAGYNWEELLQQISLSVEPISVRIVNSETNKSEWDKVYDQASARIIAVGGDVLSRGLTLEGLSTSYFYRRSFAYDTLMQMGRWFGYRDGYLDLCRLWIDQQVSTWYRFIGKAISELRDDLYTMKAAGLTPKEFGLAVLRHPGSVLTVTAFNKRRHGQLQRKVSMRNYDAETALLPFDEVLLEENYSKFEELYLNLASKEAPQIKGKRIFWKNISPELVADFVEQFHAHLSQPLLLDDQVATWIRTTKAPWMQKWDVVLMGGEGSLDTRFGSNFFKPRRAVLCDEVRGTIYFSGTRQKLSGTGDISTPLEPEALARIDHSQAESYDNKVRRILEKPVLVLYPVEPLDELTDKTKAHSRNLEKFGGLKSGNPLIGFRISFPNKVTDVESDENTMTYIVNRTFQRIQRIFSPGMDDGDDFE
jgi:hypothetical protein